MCVRRREGLFDDQSVGSDNQSVKSDDSICTSSHSIMKSEIKQGNDENGNNIERKSPISSTITNRVIDTTICGMPNIVNDTQDAIILQTSADNAEEPSGSDVYTHSEVEVDRCKYSFGSISYEDKSSKNAASSTYVGSDSMTPSNDILSADEQISTKDSTDKSLLSLNQKIEGGINTECEIEAMELDSDTQYISAHDILIKDKKVNRDTKSVKTGKRESMRCIIRKRSKLPVGRQKRAAFQKASENISLRTKK